jgi:hypothetical protein
MLADTDLRRAAGDVVRLFGILGKSGIGEGAKQKHLKDARPVKRIRTMKRQ